MLFFAGSLDAQILLDSERLGYQTADASIWEIGIKGGPGYRSKDRFENNLQNFTSTFQPGIFSNTNTFGFRDVGFSEFVFRLAFAENQRFGFSVGNLNFHKAGLQEFTSDGYITRLDFDISTVYVIFTYHYIWNLNKKWSIEAGMGFGGNQTSWGAGGYSTNGIEYFPQKGSLRGNGISLRMESGVNYRINENFTLQMGLMWGLHSVPSFSGTWNGNIATFYIREDGKTTPLTESRATDAIILTNQFTRALDMNASHAGLYFSALLRFSY
ncbi:MAG: hypothetical protein JJT78_03955 [Leptospira sp.]|nr:hypothetical protein [Leptospira sp.]